MRHFRFCVGTLGGQCLAGAFLAVSGDAFQQLGGGFVLRVLRDEPAGEGVAEDGLPQRLRALELRFQPRLDVLDDGKLIFDSFDNGILLG